MVMHACDQKFWLVFVGRIQLKDSDQTKSFQDIIK